ncbi:hypothetical protein EVJ20_13390 [Exiguobacterium sp. SH0S1]|uniref:hypothetical protein n=1 Tax=Exiguobacterium sp. SH0S1 TaxID=2510949 RepID=UPI00103E41EB|nr:hypothetical protein [Exiguobacterium sp. SH0S1]TCI75677.1 hypothetical protein EVJ20_13390 [Exiguobacterium sp. SH0S1]
MEGYSLGTMIALSDETVTLAVDLEECVIPIETKEFQLLQILLEHPLLLIPIKKDKSGLLLGLMFQDVSGRDEEETFEGATEEPVLKEEV